MEELVDHFSEQLLQQLGIASTETLLANGTYQITVDDTLHIYIYPHHVSDRLSAQHVTKTIHLDQDMLTNDFKKIMVRIKVSLGQGQKIHARTTVAARIDKKTALEFQEEHHLQVALPGKYRYGLYHQGELVSIAVFSGGRKMENKPDGYRSFELLRFCHKSDLITIGGISKLIRAFCSDFDPGDIMTYVDRDWSQDSTLQKIGFQVEKTTEPQLFTIESGKRQLQRKQSESETRESPDNYLKRNSGSIKMVLHLQNPD